MGMSAGGNPSSRTVMSEINVTPLVDVMLVLLIIFMVTAPMLQQGLQVDLPETKSGGIPPAENPLVLVIQKSGRFSIAGTDIPRAQLEEKLSSILKSRRTKDVYVQADKSVVYGLVAEAMAEIKSAGATGISLVTVPK
jgi:biopolymer transport protein TolR